MTTQPITSDHKKAANLISRRTFLRYLAAGAAVAGGGPMLYAAAIEPNSVEVVEQTIELPGLGQAFSGLRAIQLSDLHAGMWFGRDHLAKVFQLALDQRPDLIFITGDFMTDGGDTARAGKDLTSSLPLLTGAVPVIAVRGNHDHDEPESTLTEVFARTGVLELKNAFHTMRRGSDILHIAGIDSVSTGHQDLGKVANEAPTDAPVILLAHEPDMAEFSAPTGKFAMQISGHSHGGQVRLPFFGRTILPWMARKYPAGLYRVGEMWQYTNRGIGMIHVPFRLNCPPEITVFTFVSAA